MNDTNKEVDYLKIQQDFEEITDYRTFILQYSHVQHEEVQILIIYANWWIILNELDHEQKIKGIGGFIRKYNDHPDQRIRNLIVHALFLQLEQNRFEPDDDHHYLELCNSFIEYILSIERLESYAYKGLILAYWCKAQAIHEKDWRKAQYFYNKVIDFSQQNLEEAYSIYMVKAEIAKFNLHLHFKHLEDMGKIFYSIMQKHASDQHLDIRVLLDHMINSYIHYLVDENSWFYQAQPKGKFLDFLSNHVDMQKIMLKSTIKQNAIPRLVWVSYAYWENQYYLLADQYLLRYFYFFEDWAGISLSFKEYVQFNAEKDRQSFWEYAESLYKRHITLEKYRKMFRLDKTKN